MGSSDKYVHISQRKFLNALLFRRLIKKYKGNKVKKIAFLGECSLDRGIVRHYEKNFAAADIDVYDILLENWDLNDAWSIEDYDIVVCHRTSMYVDSRIFFFEQLKSCIENNKHVIFDFTYYNQKIRRGGPPPGLDGDFDPRDYVIEKKELDKIPSFWEDPPSKGGITRKAFQENNIMDPLYVGQYWNKQKKDLIVYMFWST